MYILKHILPFELDIIHMHQVLGWDAHRYTDMLGRLLHQYSFVWSAHLNMDHWIWIECGMHVGL